MHPTRFDRWFHTEWDGCEHRECTLLVWIACLVTCIPSSVWDFATTLQQPHSICTAHLFREVSCVNVNVRHETTDFTSFYPDLDRHRRLINILLDITLSWHLFSEGKSNSFYEWSSMEGVTCADWKIEWKERRDHTICSHHFRCHRKKSQRNDLFFPLYPYTLACHRVSQTT